MAVCFVLNATHRLLSTGQLINAGFSLTADKQGTSITAHNKTYFVGEPDIYAPTIQWIGAMIIKPQFKVYGASVHNDNFIIWHHQMGHPSKDVMKQIFSNMNGFDKALSFLWKISYVTVVFKERQTTSHIRYQKQEHHTN